MSCKCDSCLKSKEARSLRHFQPEVHKRGPSKYATKSNKILMDRFLSAQRNLKLYIKWYQQSWEDKKTNPPIPAGSPWVYWYHEAITRTHYCARKYRECRAEVKKRGLI